MKKILLTLALSASFSSLAFAQHLHSDIEFGYDDPNNPTSIFLEGPETTGEGIAFYESEMESDGAGDLFAEDPGFSAEEPGEGLVVNTGDQVCLTFLDASSSSLTSLGAGYANFYDPNGSGGLTASGEFNITTGTLTTSPTTVSLNGGTIGAEDSAFIDQGDADGHVHNHLLFDLLQDSAADVGAYGFLVQLKSTLATPNDAGDSTVTSDPFWIIVNNGLEEDVFEGPALLAFGAVESIPEPTSGIILTMIAGALVARRRRNS